MRQPDSSSGKPRARLAVFLEAGGAGGAEHVLLAYLAALKGGGWHVDAVMGGTPSEENRAKFALWGPGIGFIIVPWRRRTAYRVPVILPSLDRSRVHGLREILQGLKPDLVLINQPGPDDAQGAIRAAVRLRPAVPVIPFIHMAVGRLIRVRLRALKALWARHLYRQVHRVITVAEANVQCLSQEYGLAPERISVVHNGVKPVQPLAKAEADALRSSLGLGRDEWVVLWAGRFTIEKGVDVLLQAAELVMRSGAPIRFLLAGDGPMQPELEREHQQLLSGGVARFLGWRNDVGSLLQIADVVALPSRVESCGLFAAEAMAAGVPVVASGVHGIPELVTDGETGVLVPPEDPRALADAVMRVAGNPDLRLRLGRAGRERYEGHFTLERASERFEKALLDMLGRAEP